MTRDRRQDVNMARAHDPARGPFDVMFDVNSSMLTGTRIMRVGKTAQDQLPVDLRERHREWLKGQPYRRVA
jgi:hypothetical protein